MANYVQVFLRVIPQPDTITITLLWQSSSSLSMMQNKIGTRTRLFIYFFFFQGASWYDNDDSSYYFFKGK